MPIAVGDQAPDFALKDQHGRTVCLADLRGRKAALVVFYPWAFSGVCGGELLAMQADLDDLVSDEVELVTVSTDSMYALRSFADQEGRTERSRGRTASCTRTSASRCAAPSWWTATASFAGRSSTGSRTPATSRTTSGLSRPSRLRAPRAHSSAG